jgi:hypothetical protein
LSQRVYRTSYLGKAASVIIFMAGIFFLIAVWGGIIWGTRQAKIWEMLFPILYLALASYFVARAFAAKIMLTDQAIELRTLSGRKTLPFDKIRGRRRYLSRGDADSPSIWHLKLEPNDDHYPILDFEESYNFDASFFKWLGELPDLDEVDKTLHRTSNFGLV